MSESDEKETHSQKSPIHEDEVSKEKDVPGTESAKVDEEERKNENEINSDESEKSVEHKKKSVKRKRRTKVKAKIEANSVEESQNNESENEKSRPKQENTINCNDEKAENVANDEDKDDTVSKPSQKETKPDMKERTEKAKQKKSTSGEETENESDSTEKREKPKNKVKRSKSNEQKLASEEEAKSTESNTDNSQSSKSTPKYKKGSLPKPPLILSSRSEYEVHDDNNVSDENLEPSQNQQQKQSTDQGSQNGDQNRPRTKVTRLEIPNEEKTPVQQAFDNLVEHGKRPPNEYARGVNRMLQQAALEALEKEDYDRAEKIEVARNKLGAGVEEEAAEQNRQQRRSVLQSRLDAARDEYKKLENEWKEVLRVFRDEQNNLRAQLEERHSQELEEFEQRWESVEDKSAFNKPSPQLLSLRRQQKVLALSKQFAAAKVVKAEADRLSNIENMEAMKRAVATMQKELAIIEERQKKELDYFEEHRWRTEVYITGEKQAALHPVEMQIKQLEAALDETPMNKKPTSRVFTSTFKTRTIRAESAVPLLPRSPRTSRAYNQYRVADEPAKLELGRINMRQYLKKRPGSVARMNRLISTK